MSERNQPPEKKPDEVKKILTTISSESQQIDAFAKLRGYFRPEEGSHSFAAIQAYLNGEIDVQTAVNRIAEPIEEQYTTADKGRQLKNPPDTSYKKGFSTEGYLWDLWYSVLHTARCTTWDDDNQLRLVELVKELKKRPNPPRYEPQVQDWVVGAPNLWSSLVMIGPSARESWNDVPGAGAGFALPEIHAWRNINAFVARITKDGISNFWLYCVWAMLPALEEDVKRNEKYQLDASVPAAAVWAIILRKDLYAREDSMKPEHPNGGNPARPGQLFNGETGLNKERWRFWRQRFSEMAEDGELKDETKAIAKTAFESMSSIEESGSSS